MEERSVYDDFMGGSSDVKRIVKIPIHQLIDYNKHTFKVVQNKDMEELINSIKVIGIQEPPVVKLIGRNKYEIISGHRRIFAARSAGITSVDCIVSNSKVQLAPEEVAEQDIAMIDTNLGGNRRDFLPSELLNSLLLKRDALKALAKSGKTYDGDIGTAIANGTYLSRASIYKYLKLENLIPELLELVDAKQIQFAAAGSFAELSVEEQQRIAQYLTENPKAKVNPKKAAEIAALGEDATDEEIAAIVNPPKQKKNEEIIESGYPKCISKFFKEGTSVDEITVAIVKALEKTMSHDETLDIPLPKINTTEKEMQAITPEALRSGRSQKAYKDTKSKFDEVYDEVDYGEGIEITGRIGNDVETYRVSYQGSITMR